MARIPVAMVAVIVGAVFAALVMWGVVAERPQARQQRSGWLDGDHVTLEPIITGLKEPTYVAWPPDGSGRAFVLERGGLVRIAGSDGRLQVAPSLDLTQQGIARKLRGSARVGF